MSKIFGASILNAKAELVGIETLLGRGLNRTIVVGMVDNVTREARDRLPAALAAQGYTYPKGKVLFNLAPAELPKGGLPQDLALAISLLIESEQMPPPQGKWLCLGELGLNGEIRPPARGTLLAALKMQNGFQGIISANDSALEAAIAPGVRSFGAVNLAEAVEIINNSNGFEPVPAKRQETAVEMKGKLEDVRGQEHARMAAIISVCGRHPLLLQGPPGTGKSLLARRIANLLPDLNQKQALEVAEIEACLGRVPLIPKRPPFRSPHSSTSAQGVLGGGRPLRPGEISRAHLGVLFLDELPEFKRPILEGLRQPLEEKLIHLQRADHTACFPADTLLIAARNPCPCGFATHPKIPCRCTPLAAQRYLNKTSGPLLDRFDLFVEMGPVDPELFNMEANEPSQKSAQEALCRSYQMQQYRGRQGLPTHASKMELHDLKECGVQPLAQVRLEQAASQLHLSGRSNLRCLRVARSIADLNEEEIISERHIIKAISYRPPQGNATA